jgi:hypothetical protein
VAGTADNRRRATTLCALAAAAGANVSNLPLMPATWTLGARSSYPNNWRNVTHGWRWYKVENGMLLSPLQGYPLALPRDGHLPGAYFVPRAANMWPMVLMLRDKRPYPFAFTFGTVSGPFQRDFAMPRIGSMSATEYRAKVILTDGMANLAYSYDLPVVQDEIDLPLLLRIEADAPVGA